MCGTTYVLHYFIAAMDIFSKQILATAIRKIRMVIRGQKTESIFMVFMSSSEDAATNVIMERKYSKYSNKKIQAFIENSII